MNEQRSQSGEESLVAPMFGGHRERPGLRDAKGGAVNAPADRFAIYHRTQLALLELKCAVIALIDAAGNDGLTNVAIGRALGINHGYLYSAGTESHTGQLTRWILGELQREEMVFQTCGKSWVVNFTTSSLNAS